MYIVYVYIHVYYVSIYVHCVFKQYNLDSVLANLAIFMCLDVLLVHLALGSRKLGHSVFFFVCLLAY